MFKINRSSNVTKMSRSNKPVLIVPTGSTVEFETYDCFKAQITSSSQRLDELDWENINPATGPLFIDGAMPGDLLKITIKDIKVDQRGVMAAIPEAGLFGNKVSSSEIKVMEIVDGVVKFSEDFQIPISPMIGVIGVAPMSEDVPCGVPGSHGGNMDNKVIKTGSIVYLPVFCEGGLLSMGDLHAIMGDGEVMVSGVEVNGRVVVEVDLIKNFKLNNPLIEDKDNYYTVASHEDFLEALKICSKDMLDLISSKYDLPFNEAGMLISAIGNSEICQVVDPLLTARFRVSKALLKKGLI